MKKEIEKYRREKLVRDLENLKRFSPARTVEIGIKFVEEIYSLKRAIKNE